MRTVFVNPSSSRRRRNPAKKSGRRPKRYVRIRHKVYKGSYKNPDLGMMLRETSTIAIGAAGGALLNRLGASHITNFYARNGARVLAAALIASMGRQQPIVAIAAAGAVLAPMVPEIEMQMASVTGTKNPNELAAELSELLEADLSDELEDGEEIADELEDGEEIY